MRLPAPQLVRALSRPPVVRGSRAAAALLACSAAVLLAGCGGGEDEGFDPAAGTIELVDRGWYCSGEVDLDRLKVTIESEDVDAIHLGRGCTGRIGEIEVIQHRLDGVKVSEGAHDVVIERGTVACLDQKPGSHQDGVQVMGGRRITFLDLRVECPTRSSGLFIRLGGRGEELPTDVVCDGCHILGGGYSVRVNESVRSGVRNSTLCEGGFGALKILDGAVDPVDDGNRRVDCS